jgi:hypothetical protein
MTDGHAALVQKTRAVLQQSWAIRRASMRAVEEGRAVVAASKALLRRIAEWEAAVAANVLISHPPRPTV